jgi:hypothetical protein
VRDEAAPCCGAPAAGVMRCAAHARRAHRSGGEHAARGLTGTRSSGHAGKARARRRAGGRHARRGAPTHTQRRPRRNQHVARQLSSARALVVRCPLFDAQQSAAAGRRVPGVHYQARRGRAD